MNDNPLRLRAYIKFIDGKVECLCLASDKRCSRRCCLDIVEWDRWRGWQVCMKNEPEGRGTD